MLTQQTKLTTKESPITNKVVRQQKSSHVLPSKTNSKISTGISSNANFYSGNIKGIISGEQESKFIKPFIVDLLNVEEINTLLSSDVSNDYIVQLYSKVEPFLINVGVEINQCNRTLPAFVSDYFKRFMEYNMNSGKRLRTITVIRISCGLLKESGVSFDHKIEFLTAAFLCSFLIELIQMSVLAADDVMDSSLTRRKKKCWYLNDDAGLAAINDAVWGFTLSNLYFKRFVFSSELSLLLMNELNELKLRLCCGQGIDGMLQNFAKNWEEENLTFKNFELVTQYKTTFYTFYYPSLFPYLIHSIINASFFNLHLDLDKYRRSLEEYTRHLGLLFGAQDDYLDVFGNYDISGKIGSDIEEGKCTFLLIKALKNLNSPSFCYSNVCLANKDKTVCSCNIRTKVVLSESIGIKDKEKIKIAREILVNCGVEKEFHEYSREVVGVIENCEELNEYPIVENVLGLILKRIKSRQD